MMRLLSALVSLTATVTALAVVVLAAATSSSTAVIVVALDPTDVLALSPLLRWDETNDANDAKGCK